MAAGNVSRVIRNAGKLVVGPTDLTAADPYGGTEIGLMNAAVLVPRGEPRMIWNEGLGDYTDALEPWYQWTFTCFLRGSDDSAKTLLLKGNRTVGSKTQHGVYTAPNSRTPGQSMIDYSNVVVLFVPENLIDHDALILYRAIPVWDDAAELAFQKREEFGFPLTFRLMRDSTGGGAAVGNTHQWARLPDLTLP